MKRDYVVQTRLNEDELFALSKFEQKEKLPNTSEAIRFLIRLAAREYSLWPKEAQVKRETA